MFYFYNSYLQPAINLICRRNYLQQVESEIEDQSTKLGFQTVNRGNFSYRRNQNKCTMWQVYMQISERYVLDSFGA